MAFEHVRGEAVLRGMVRKEFAWRIISDFASYPRFMDNVDNVIVHEKNAHDGKSEWFVTVEEAPLAWLERDFYDPDNFEIRFESIDGDFDNINGSWKVSDIETGGVHISFSIDYNLGIPVIEEVLGDILKEKMKSNIDAMLNAIKAELESTLPDERKYKRYTVNKHNTLVINGSPVRAYVINVSRKGMMFYYDGTFDDNEAEVRIGNVIIAADALYNDVKHHSTRLIFREAIDKKLLNGVLDHLSTANIRTHSRKLIERDAVLDYGDAQANVHILNISPRGMFLRYREGFEASDASFDLCGVRLTPRRLFQDVGTRTVRMQFDQELGADVYQALLEKLQSPDSASLQTTLPL
jgi:ribosome-associated toxin RatA of RatAB toxin-antitoxin module